MSGNSSVGQASVYEAGDQRNAPQSEIKTAERYQEGVTNSHQTNDAKDQRSIANRIADESKHRYHDTTEKPHDAEAELAQQDATKPAKMHGNEPSKGAKIDAQIQKEEEEELKKKGINPN